LGQDLAGPPALSGEAGEMASITGPYGPGSCKGHQAGACRRAMALRAPYMRDTMPSTAMAGPQAAQVSPSPTAKRSRPIAPRLGEPPRLSCNRQPVVEAWL